MHNDSVVSAPNPLTDTSPAATRTPGSTGGASKLKTLAPGVLLATSFGAAAFAVSQQTPSMSPLIWAILLGAAAVNLVRLPAVVQPGITFSAKQILRLAVGLLGFRLGISQVLAVGPLGIAVVVFAVVGTYLFSSWVGKKFGLSSTLSSVLAAGTSICGAAAIVAVAGVVDAKEEETAVGVGTVTLYGTLAMFLYPIIAHLVGMTPAMFGLWAGASIHEVAQVVAAGFSFDAGSSAGSAVEVATVVKLGRVLMLAPMAVALSFAFRKARSQSSRAKVSPVPWFIVLFIATVAIRSTNMVPTEVMSRLVQADTLLLAVAMAGLGLDLRWAKVKAAGLKPLYATFLGTAFIGAATFALVKLLA